MEILAILTGLTMGAIIGNKTSEHLMILFYHRNFLSEEKYMQLYDFIDDEFHYEMYAACMDKPPKNYAEFLKLHQKIRPKAYRIFRRYIEQLALHQAKILGLYVLLPMVIFYRQWYIFLITVTVVVAGFALYKRYRKDNGVDFNAILMMITVLKDKN